MIELFEKYGDKIAVFSKSETLSYSQLCRRVCYIKGTLELGTIAICMKHGIDYLIYMLAAIENGNSVFLLNPSSKSDSLKYLEENHIPVYTDEASKKNIIGMYVSELLLDTFHDYDSISKEEVEMNFSADMKANIILSTSGTTSETVKYVKIPVNNMILKSHMISEYLNIREDDVNFFISPLCFVQTIWTSFIHLFKGASLFFSEFVPKRFDEMLKDYGITTIVTVPAVIRGIIDNNMSSYSLRLVSIGGDYMDEKLLKKLKEKWPKVLYANVYGATETCAADTILSPREFGNLDESYYTLGSTTCFSKVFITNSSGEVIRRNEIGNICIQSPFLIDKYLNVKKEIRNANGYFETYDQGYLDGDNRLHYIGRDTSIIVYNGRKIAACEIEKLLYELEGVLEVVVVGKHHNIYGQIPVAFIVQDGNLDECIIRTFLEERIEKYKIPKVVNFVGELKKTNSGKVIRKYEVYE